MYPAPKHRVWTVQIEFFDGTVIDATSDEDAVDRWRRLAAWSDEVAATNPVEWMNRIIGRARAFYNAKLTGLNGLSSPEEILEALNAESCLYLRRK